MLYFLSPFWFIRTVKNMLFWLYLWQLKEYHIGRFKDHFRTTKGKNLLFNELLFTKIFLLYFLSFNGSYVFWVIIAVTLIYFIESAKTIDDFLRRKIKKPVITKKTILLVMASLSSAILFLLLLLLAGKNLRDVVFWLLAFDIFTPVIVSVIVLLFQPLTVFKRNKILERARKKRAGFKDILVIGITGSYGKTSTKEFLASILSSKFNVLKTKEHQNSEMGIARCILNDLKQEHKYFVCEMGAYNKGGIKLLCKIAKPKIGIICGANEQHLAVFGSMNNLLSAEGGIELVECLPDDGVAFFNAKNKHSFRLYEKTDRIKKVLYGENVEIAGLENIEGAKAVARELGMTEEEICNGVKKIKNKFPGINLKKYYLTANKEVIGLNIIDATYSSNPTGVIAHLEYLQNWSGKKILVMPCLIELGSASKIIHQKIGEKIARTVDLAIITSKERLEDIQKGAIVAGMDRKNIVFMENPKAIFDKIKTFCLLKQSNDPENVILLENRTSKELIRFFVAK